ncbi:Ig family protein [Oceanithermus profundus DSM 14977]|uniref:Ig family protein n=1 Tax=Oceanithermus profundus (strain DSM 14977 / NBRC 100410 / VKM B-2274 / 506) TaxID=670487 RepID=E4U6B6_OCEP5|nr:putative Ig domain-containing protein [Oceanithermus profundus]ADR35536.1 Ig family protein [Oceanithermus profundus DSM 14977]
MRLAGVLIAAALLLAACGTSEGGAGEPLRITVRSAPPAYIGERYEAKFPASGGVRPYRYELEGKLPQGLNFTNGRLSGIPREKGSFKVTVVVTDAALSSRSASFTLAVKDPPPPALRIKIPESETDAPFIAVFTLSERPASALRLRLTAKDLKPDLDSFKAAPELLYVLRYDAEKQTLDLDGAFTKTFKGGEVFRLKFEPTRKLRPRVQAQTQFFDAKGEPYTKSPPKRPADQGRYAFEDLRALAAAWGRKPAAQKGEPAPPAAGAPTKAEPSAPESAGGAGTAPEPGAETAPEGGAAPAPEAKAPPAGAEGEAAPKFDPDLNGDGAVNAADLELLRKDYAFNPGGRLTPPSVPKAPAPGAQPAPEDRPSENPTPPASNPGP